jgi:hypothetical protein
VIVDAENGSFTRKVMGNVRPSLCGEETAATVPALVVLAVDEAQVGLVHEGGGLEGLAGLFLSQPGGGQAAQLFIDQREQFGAGAGIALLNGREDARDVAHAVRPAKCPVGEWAL